MWSLLRPRTERQRRLRRALWIIFGLFAVSLFVAGALNAPEWLNSAIIVAYPVTWLVTAAVISLRSRG